MLKSGKRIFLLICLLFSALCTFFEAMSKEQIQDPTQSHVQYIQSIKDEINQVPKAADVKLVKLVGDFLSKVQLPAPAKALFNTALSMRNVQITTDIPPIKNIRASLGFTGSMFINKVEVRGTMYVLIDDGLKPQFVLMIEMPEHYKISSLFPQFKKLDILSLPKPKYTLTTFDYMDQDGLVLRKGLNFVATLDLSGPLSILRAIKEQAKKLDSIIVKDEPIRFTGHIPSNVTDARFGAVIPIRFGVDFTKIKKLPKSITNVFKQFTSDDFEFNIVFPKFEMTIETGVRLVLGTQKDPIRLSTIAVIEPVSRKLSLAMRMRNELELKWISFGNAAIQVDFDADLMPITSAVGIPFTGIGVRGEISVGKPGTSRATFKAAGAIEVSNEGIPPLIWELEATDIRFEDIVALLVQITRKKAGKIGKFPSDKIPTMRINKARGYLATEDKTLAKKFYKAGVALTFDAQFFNQKVLFDIEIRHKELKMDGIGYLSNIELKNKQGKRLFALTGPGIDQKYGTKDDGPIAFCSFDVKQLLDAAFGVRGTVEIPPLNLKAKTDLVMTGKSFKADMEAKIAGFTGIFQVNIDPLKMKEMFVRIGFKRDFDQFLLNAIKQKLTESKQKLMAGLEEINKDIEGFSKEVGELRKKTAKGMQTKIKQTEAEIRKLGGVIASKEKKRDALKAGKEKRQLTRELATLKIALAAKKTALVTYKASQKVADVTVGALELATKGLADAKLAQKATSAALNTVSGVLDGIAKGRRIIQVKEAVGSYSMPEMMEGKSPKLEKLVIVTEFPGRPKKTIVLKDVQFDFKKPVDAARNIVKSILQKVGIDTEKMEARRAARKEKRQERRAARKERRAPKKEARKEKRAEKKEERKEKREVRKEKRAPKKEARKEKRAGRKEKRTERREKRKSRRK